MMDIDWLQVRTHKSKQLKLVKFEIELFIHFILFIHRHFFRWTWAGHGKREVVLDGRV
jgi:hypothetical protein